METNNDKNNDNLITGTIEINFITVNSRKLASHCIEERINTPTDYKKIFKQLDAGTSNLIYAKKYDYINSYLRLDDEYVDRYGERYIKDDPGRARSLEIIQNVNLSNFALSGRWDKPTDVYLLKSKKGLDLSGHTIGEYVYGQMAVILLDVRLARHEWVHSKYGESKRGLTYEKYTDTELIKALANAGVDRACYLYNPISSIDSYAPFNPMQAAAASAWPDPKWIGDISDKMDYIKELHVADWRHHVTKATIAAQELGPWRVTEKQVQKAAGVGYYAAEYAIGRAKAGLPANLSGEGGAA